MSLQRNANNLKVRPQLCMLLNLGMQPIDRALCSSVNAALHYTLYPSFTSSAHRHNAMTPSAKLKCHWAERCAVTPTSPLPNWAWGKTTFTQSSKSSLDTHLSHSLERWALAEDGIKHISVCWCFNVSRWKCWPGSTPNTGSAPVGREKRRSTTGTSVQEVRVICRGTKMNPSLFTSMSFQC